MSGAQSVYENGHSSGHLFLIYKQFLELRSDIQINRMMKYFRLEY